jgi:hypothetical protein
MRVNAAAKRPFPTSIVVEIRPPQGKDEKDLLGRTWIPTDKMCFKVWLNSKQDDIEMADTFFHELMHVYIAMFHNERMSDELEHNACKWVGEHAREFMAFKRG